MTKLHPEILSITSGPRQSNFEILRILATVLVLVVHSDFYSIGEPDIEDFQNNPLSSFTRTFFEAVSIVCVNVFILISGWFGIKASIKGFLNFTFQCLFFLCLIYILLLVCGQTSISLKGIAECLCLTSPNWFIRAYAALYILSPVLNAFVEKASKKKFCIVIIAFFLFQSIWGWSGAAQFVEQGFSTFSFIGLYLLARYIRLYGCAIVNYLYGGAIYIASILLNTVSYYMTVRYEIPLPPIFVYDNPVVIIGALSLLLFFNGIKINPNKYINWVAKSAFAVFLLHTNPNIIYDYFKPLMVFIYDSYSGMWYIFLIIITLLAIFVLAIILDQPRKLLWSVFDKFLSAKTIMTFKI